MNAESRSQESEARIASAAQRWLGTPWCANSEACGPRGGVACHNLPRAILMEAGLLPLNFPQITGDPTRTLHSKVSVMEPWLDQRTEFVRVGVHVGVHVGVQALACPGTLKLELQPGDLLGFRIGHCINHLALYLGHHTFIHVLMHKQTCIDSLTDPTWSSRLLAAWRVKIINH